jgi:hypothetical protein
MESILILSLKNQYIYIYILLKTHSYRMILQKSYLL